MLERSGDFPRMNRGSVLVQAPCVAGHLDRDARPLSSPGLLVSNIGRMVCSLQGSDWEFRPGDPHVVRNTVPGTARVRCVGARIAPEIVIYEEKCNGGPSIRCGSMRPFATVYIPCLQTCSTHEDIFMLH